jgi:hypothetical protein
MAKLGTAGLATTLLAAWSPVLQGQAGVPRMEARRVAAFPEPFSQVRGLRELPSGVVLVTDWIEERLVALDFRTGRATAIGRVGGGPREFRLPAQLLPWPGDSTMLYDEGNARLAIIGPDLVIHRTMPANTGDAPYAIYPRSADAAGRLYFGIPPWALGPDAPPGDSVDIVRWDPRRRAVETVFRVLGAQRPSWQRDGRPRMTPGIPMVMYSPQDGWAVSLDGRAAVVRAGDYHVEWSDGAGRVTRGRSYAYRKLAVTDADKRAFVLRFLQSSPMSGKGAGGSGLGHTPAEFASPEQVAEMVRTNEFAETHPYFRPGGVWLAPAGDLWVERSVPADAAPVLDVFDGAGRLMRQVTLPAGHRVVGMGRGVIFSVVRNADDLETIEKYGTN